MGAIGSSISNDKYYVKTYFGHRQTFEYTYYVEICNMVQNGYTGRRFAMSGPCNACSRPDALSGILKEVEFLPLYEHPRTTIYSCMVFGFGSHCFQRGQRLPVDSRVWIGARMSSEPACVTGH